MRVIFACLFPSTSNTLWTKDSDALTTDAANTKLVLLVGQDAKYFLFLRDALQSHGFELYHVQNVVAARAFRQARPEVRLFVFDALELEYSDWIDEFRADGANQVIVVLPVVDGTLSSRLMRCGVFDLVVKSYREERVVGAVLNAHKLVDYSMRFRELNEIGVALSREHELGSLLELILRRCRDITFSDAGSLYLKVVPKPVEEDEGPMKRRAPAEEPYLVFKVAQNDSLDLPYKEFPLPINKKSIAGYVAATGDTVNIEDAYHIAEDAEIGFDPSWDKKAGYHTKSMLVVPMRNHANEVIGVIQLINRKIRKADTLSPEDTDRKVIPYDNEFEEMALSLASQAGVAVENTLLLDDVTQLLHNIETLFNGFVMSSAAAIEARDNTTAGHSERICEYALAIAHRMNELSEGPFAEVEFTDRELKELEYASILHDIGKIGVPEKVLVKATRLDEAAVDMIRYRFAYFQEHLKQEALRKQMEHLLALDAEARGSEATKELIQGIDEALGMRIAEIDGDIDFICDINKLGFLNDENEKRLEAIARKRLLDADGVERPFLSDFEYENLAVKKGNLTDLEREKINEHVVHTYRILSRIPWNKELAKVPLIAGCHHERNDGSGYPKGLKKDEIPLQARILAVVDVYEALTAQDRPYKKAKPKHVAIKILQEEAKYNRLDPEIVDLFIRDELYDIVVLNDPAAVASMTPPAVDPPADASPPSEEEPARKATTA